MNRIALAISVGLVSALVVYLSDTRDADRAMPAAGTEPGPDSSPEPNADPLAAYGQAMARAGLMEPAGFDYDQAKALLDDSGIDADTAARIDDLLGGMRDMPPLAQFVLPQLKALVQERAP
ncbi:MAG: hypothetical protein OIF47_05835 [Marinibacterium sp.]|nr:hypothetical protein [Marinibacterium sp.]